MAIFRLLFLTLITVVVLGMLNYIFMDKLSYSYIVVVIAFVSIVFIYSNKLCLSYLKASQLAANMDEELINLSKSITFGKSIRCPKIYRIDSSEKSMIVLSSVAGWDIVISNSTLEKLSFEQKRAIIKAAIKIKENDSLSLKTFGLSIKILILKLVNNKFMSSKSIKKILFIFISPVFLFLNALTIKSLSINLDRSLLEFKKDKNLELNLFEKIFLSDSNFDLFQSYNVFENMDISYE